MNIKNLLKKIYLSKGLDWDTLITLVNSAEIITNVSKLELELEPISNGENVLHNLYPLNLYLIDSYKPSGKLFLMERIWYGNLLRFGNLGDVLYIECCSGEKHSLNFHYLDQNGYKDDSNYLNFNLIIQKDI